MINTRLMYIKQHLDKLHLAQATEQVDQLLSQAIYMEKLNNKISIYGNLNTEELLVGREVAGREENLYGHDVVQIQDFAAENVQSENITYEDFQDLIQKAKHKTKSYGQTHFRIQIDLDEFSQAEVYFFNNLEKYIGPACA